MVRNIKYVILIIIFLFITINLRSQNITNFDLQKKYYKMGLSIGGAMYRYPTIKPLFGKYTIQPIPIPSYSFGVSLNIPTNSNWSIETGIFMMNEPSIFSKLQIPYEEIQESESSYFEHKTKMYIIYSTSFPLLVKYQIKINEKSFLNLQMGLKAMFLFPNSSSQQMFIALSDTTEISPFRIYAESPNEYFIGSLVYGIGYSYAFKYCLITASLNHTINFNNTNEGLYVIRNLVHSSDSGGEYKLSGDYFSLNLNFQFLKFKSKKKVSEK